MALPPTQRAQVLQSFNTPYTLTTTHPTPSPPTTHHLLIRVLAASYCHTDTVFASGSMWQGLPRIGSHEFAGTIHSIGPGVPKSLDLKVGQLVGCPGRAFDCCGKCYECSNNDGDPKGYGVWCKRAGNLGLTVDGGFQEYAIVDARQVAPVPQIPGAGPGAGPAMEATDVAPLMCAGVTIWNALERGLGLKNEQMVKGGAKGKTVAISGAGGGLGHLGVQFAARLGARVLAVEVGDKQLDLLNRAVEGLGREDGGRVVVVDARVEAAEAIRKHGMSDGAHENEHGADTLLVLPEAQAAFDYGMTLLKDHSRCVFVSFPIDGFKINPRDVVFRHIEVLGVLVGRNRQLRAMLEFAAKEGVRAVKREYRLEDLNQLVEDYHKNEGGKLVVNMTL